MDQHQPLRLEGGQLVPVNYLIGDISLYGRARGRTTSYNVKIKISVVTQTRMMSWS